MTAESLGTIEVFGTILSTEVQTLLIALRELGIKYIHHPAMPNSSEVSALSPFGTIPVLVHRPNAMYSTKDSVTLYELPAICQYLDEVVNTRGSNGPTSALMPRQSDTGKDYADVALLRTEILQLCSIVRSYIQTTVENHYVKPYFALRNNGASENDIAVALQDQLDNATGALVMLERLIHNTQERVGVKKEADFLVGDAPTWVAAHLFPILRDFRATHPKVLIGGPNEKLPHLTQFLQVFEKRESATSVFQGTFASSA